MNKIQKNLFQLVSEIDKICKDHDIKYFLAGGNALGAVRNHCFLPWDDDLDLYITRDNWDKLRHVVETEEDVLPEGRSLIYNENTEYYRNPIPRYVDNTTTAIYKSQVLAGKACGQHIELLIMDPLPKDEKEKEEYIKLLRVYTELLSPYFVVNKNLSPEDWDKHYKLYKQYCDRCDEEGEEKVLKELEEKLRSFASDEECDTYCMRWGITILMYKKEHYGKGRLEVFEDGEFPVAENAEGIFRIAYGDSWMYIPEYEEQVVHNALQDIDIPFNEYTDKYVEKINKESVFEKYRRNKRSNVSVLSKRKENEMLFAKINNKVKSEDISNYLKDKQDHLESLLENKEYDKVINEFKEYLNLQFGQFMKKYKIFVPISDDSLKTLLLSYIGQGKYFDANRLLNIRKSDGPLSDDLKNIDETIKVCRELSIARYDKKDMNLVQSLIEKYEGQYPDLLDIFRGKLWLKEMNAKSRKDFMDIDELADKALEIYPLDGETMAIKAKAKLELGNKEEAMELYEKAIHNTRNGLIWNKVKEESGLNRIEIERDMINARQ